MAGQKRSKSYQILTRKFRFGVVKRRRGKTCKRRFRPIRTALSRTSPNLPENAELGSNLTAPTIFLPGALRFGTGRPSLPPPTESRANTLLLVTDPLNPLYCA